MPLRRAEQGCLRGLVQVAELAIGFGPFHEKFVSRIVLTPDAEGGPRIETIGVEGPFRQLASHWSFEPHPDGTLIRKAGIMSIVETGGGIYVGDTIAVELPAGPKRPLQPV